MSLRLPALRLPALRIAALCISALVGALPVPLQAQVTPAGAAILRRVDAHYNHLHTLKTDFTESYDGLGLHRVESGTLLLSKPGRMRWSYTEPRGKLFVLDGKYAYSYSPGDAQAQRLPAKQMDDLRSPLRLLLGKTRLERELKNISVSSELDGSAEIKGEPAVDTGSLRALALRVDASGQILTLRLTDADGSVTTFHFQNTKDDVPVTSRDFVFSPPDGVPIVDGLAPI